MSTSFALIPTTPHEIVDIAKLAKYTRFDGPDEINPLVARKTIDQVASVGFGCIISDIINSSFETGVIPHDLKLAKIILIFKQGDSLNMPNYTPISILSYFAKIMEKNNV